MGRRTYGSGRLFERTDAAGRVSWYGSWWSGGTRVKRKLAAKRTPGTADGLTRAQAERELRKRIDRDVIVSTTDRRTLEEAGGAYMSLCCAHSSAVPRSRASSSVCRSASTSPGPRSPW